MLKQLKYFQSVVRLGSFSAAAEENFISQSAISQQVQSLERELSFALLVRKNRSFSLTPAGEYFYRKSLLLTADCDRMCAEAAKIAKGEAANLKIGYLRTYAGGEFHRALAAFSARYPDVSVSIAYGSHGELCDMLSEDRVEITLNDQRRLFSDAYENLILAARPALIEVSAHSPIAQMEAVAPAELKNFPCIPRIWRRRAFWSRAAGDFFRWRAAKGRRPNRSPVRRFWRKAIRKERNNGSIDRILLPRGRELLRRRVPPHFRRQHRKGC